MERAVCAMVGFVLQCGIMMRGGRSITSANVESEILDRYGPLMANQNWSAALQIFGDDKAGLIFLACHL